MRFSLRYVTPEGQITQELPDWVSLDLSPIFCEAGTVKVEYPVNGVNFNLLNVGTEIAVFREGVEIGDLRFIIEDMDGDDADMAEDGAKWTFTGRTTLALLERAVVYPGGWPVADPPGAAFLVSTPGDIVIKLLERAQARGTLLELDVDFDEIFDSSGDSWDNSVTISFAAGSNYYEVIAKLVEMQLIEVRMVGRTLRMYNPNNLGTDKAIGTVPVLFVKGRDITESPRKKSSRELSSVALVAGDNNKYIEVSNAPAITLYGRRETYFSQGGTEDEPTLTLLGNQYLNQFLQPKVEKTHALFYGETVPTPEPIQDFNVGDWVLSDVGQGMERLRVKQWVISLNDQGQVSGTVVLNDLFREYSEYFERRLNNITSGAVITGGSNPNQDTTIPQSPSGLSATSSSYQDNQGNTLAQVTATWAAVTHNTNGSPIGDLDGYLVWWKYSTESSYRSALWTFAPTLSWSNLLPNTGINIQVAARDRSGNVSSKALTSTTTGYDTVAPPKPSTPVVTSKLGQLFVSWDGKDEFALNMPLDLDRVEVHASPLGSGFVPDAVSLKGSLLPGGGIEVIGGLIYSATYWVKLVAVDKTGNRSAASATGSAVFTQVVKTDVGNNVIDFDNIRFKDIGNLIPDGSFEMDTTATALSIYPNVAIVSGISGSPSTKVLRVNPYTTASSTQTSVIFASGIPVSPGQRVVAIFSYKAEATANQISYIGYRFRDAAGVSLGVYAGGPFLVTRDNTWKLRQSLGATTVPANAVTMDLEYIVAGEVSATGYLYLDQLEVRLQYGTVLIEDAAINNAKIANLAVNDAKISDLAVGKITVGSLVADITLSARIKTANTGARVELNSSGLQAFNSSNQQTLTISSSTGDVSAYGTFSSGSINGTRVVVNSSAAFAGSNWPGINFYAPSSGWWDDPVIYVNAADGDLQVIGPQITAPIHPTSLSLFQNAWALTTSPQWLPSSSALCNLEAIGGLQIVTGADQQLTLNAGGMNGSTVRGLLGLYGKLPVDLNPASMIFPGEFNYTVQPAAGQFNMTWTFGVTMPAPPRILMTDRVSDRIVVAHNTAISTTTAQSVHYSLTGSGTTTGLVQFLGYQV